MNFDEWWNEDYDDSENPFEKDSFGYWAFAGWCAQQQQQPEQEPYCWVQSKLTQGMFYKEKPRKIRTIPLYTAPPKREWVGLTDVEICAAVGCPVDEVYLADFRKVINKLKVKNDFNFTQS